MHSMSVNDRLCSLISVVYTIQFFISNTAVKCIYTNDTINVQNAWYMKPWPGIHEGSYLINNISIALTI